MTGSSAPTAEAWAIILAAGDSRRLGRPKALLDLDGRSALEQVIRSCVQAGVERGVVVVGGEHEHELRDAVDVAPFEWCSNPAPEAGRLGSLRVGLEAIPAGVHVLLWPVDRPLAASATAEALLAAASADAAAGSGSGAGTGESVDGAAPFILAPTYDNGRGHPILIGSELRAGILAAAPDANLRELLRGPGIRSLSVPVQDPGIHANLDTPDVAQARIAEWRARAGS